MADSIMKDYFSRKGFFIPAAALGTLLIISLLLFFISGGKEVRRILFFPDDMTRGDEMITAVKGESRILPVYATEEENIELLVRELLLGPEYLMYDRAVPKNTKLKALILDGEKLYLDFSINIAVSDKESPLAFEDIINLIKKTVTFNFKNVRTVNITVEGQIPGSVYYAGAPDK